MSSQFVALPLGNGGGSSSAGITPNNGVILFDDFITGDNNPNNGIGTMNLTAAGNAGGGVLGNAAGVEPNGQAGRIGLVGIFTGVLNNNTGQGILLGQMGKVWAGNGMSTTFEFAVQTPPTLSTSSSEYVIEIGFGQAAFGGISTNAAALIQYQRTVSTAWMGVTASNGSLTNVVSGLTVATSTWYNFKIVLRADGSGIDFYGCVAPGNNYTLMGSSTTNLPDINNQVFPWVNIVKTGTASTTNHIAILDWIQLTSVFNNPR